MKTLTVGKLKEALKNMNDDMVVVVEIGGDGWASGELHFPELAEQVTGNGFFISSDRVEISEENKEEQEWLQDALRTNEENK